MNTPFQMDLSTDPVDIPIQSNVLTIYNLLTSGSFISDKRLDLDKCCLALGNSYYNPSEFPALRVDVKGKQDLIYTVSIFESGKVQSTGGCRPIEAKKAIMKIAKKLNRKLNYSLTFDHFENILAVFDFGFPIPLSNFFFLYKGYVDYEPDRFPAARARVAVPNKNLPLDPNHDNFLENLQNSKNARIKKKSEEMSFKIRKLMMGDLISCNDQTEWSSDGGVGSYIINYSSKRNLNSSSKNSLEKKTEWVTANIFSTGKVTFAGAKSVNSLNYVVAVLRPCFVNLIRNKALTDSLSSKYIDPSILLSKSHDNQEEKNKKIVSDLSAKIVELQHKEKLI